MKTIKLNDITYKIIKSLNSNNYVYYYTINEANDNEVVFLYEKTIEDKKVIDKVDEREYPILMNKFSLK